MVDSGVCAEQEQPRRQCRQRNRNYRHWREGTGVPDAAAEIVGSEGVYVSGSEGSGSAAENGKGETHTRAQDNLRWYKGAYQAAASAHGRTEPRRKLALAACARREADRDIKIAERRKEQALKKNTEAARVVDAERKWAERARTADRTRKWSRVAGAVQMELALHRRQ